MYLVEALVPIMGMLILFGLPMTYFFLLKWRKMNLEHGPATGLSKKTEDKINLLIEQNEEMKEELEQMRFLLGVGKKESKSLDIERYQKRNDALSDYEKEQIRIDEQNKFNY